MKRIIDLVYLAACVTVLSLTGCSFAGTPHPHNGVSPALGARALVFQDAQSLLRGFNVPKHVVTADWYIHIGEVNPNVVAPYVDYAGVQAPDVNAFDAAGIKTILYTDPNRTYAGQPMYTKDESTFAHDCNSNRIRVKGQRFTVYQMDPRSPHLEPLWAAWVNRVLGSGYNYAYIFQDSANSIHNDTAVPCGYTEATWTAASNANDIALGQKIIYNGLGTLGDGWNKPPPSILINPTTFGGELEGCYGNIGPSNPLPKKTVWNNFETTELKMSTIEKPFLCRGLSKPPAETAIAQRIYMYASFLLTYNLSTSIISEKFTTTSHMSVFPEETLVALNPLKALPANVDDLKTSQWTYGRQYAACYLWGQPIGSCAAVINADSKTYSHPFPWPGVYKHTLVLHGSGILDGGKASVTGPAPPAMVPGNSALIAIQ
jgi:hypothetical protein